MNKMNKAYSLPEWYKSARREVEKFFSPLNLIDKTIEDTSPCGRYQLDVEHYRTIQGEEDYSRGILIDRTTGELIADIKRSSPDFWHCWITQGGHTFMLCAEDTQGYTIVYVEAKKTYTYIDPKAKSGFGYEWLNVNPSPDGKYLAVEGRYLGTAESNAIYDFRNPTKLPLIKLRSLESKGSQWIDHSLQLENGKMELVNDH